MPDWVIFIFAMTAVRMFDHNAHKNEIREMQRSLDRKDDYLQKALNELDDLKRQKLV